MRVSPCCAFQLVTTDPCVERETRDALDSVSGPRRSSASDSCCICDSVHAVSRCLRRGESRPERYGMVRGRCVER